MNIRPATYEDLGALDLVFECARATMCANGNPNQWPPPYPERELLMDDIARKQLYVVEIGGKIVAAFVFALGEDPTYGYIEGAWPDDAPYGTIHRIASDGSCHGLFEPILAFCRGICPTVRIDTHADNAIVQHLAEKAGFSYCGIIYLEDGSPRMAYHLPASRR